MSATTDENTDGVFKVVQIIWRASDPEYDLWLDICPDLMSTDKAEVFLRVISSFDLVGEECSDGRHKHCAPKEHGIEDGLTKDAINEMRAFDMEEYKNFAPPNEAPRIILGRYVLQEY
jgi:hypothetical protein